MKFFSSVKLYSLIFILIFLFGCTQQQNPIKEEAEKFGQVMVGNSIFDNIEFKIDRNAIEQQINNSTCYLFLCQNKTTGFFIFTDTSLINGNCSFVAVNASDEKNVSDFYDMINDSSDLVIRPFGFGQGPRAIDFNEANAYCNYSYSYSIRFVIGNNDGYIKPLSLKPQALCSLQANVIPMFVFYNKEGVEDKYGKPPTNDNARDIASALNNIGPVFVATEINPKKDDVTFNKIMGQARAIKNACPNCTLFLSISLDEIYNNSRFYLNKTKLSPYLDLFDGFAFGIDSRFSKTKEDVGICDGRFIVINEAGALISFINMEFNKPTFIYYTYLNDTEQCFYGDNDYVAV